ncbi:hypothetical protein RRG08_012869 [Elysia crispata]|uniref:Uncharacterized protein n=1 Tax=Elysia crispata TaxID=231223 RepID=A0AAE1ASM9_9GAST|nr:hypothetical protein RRG08_012869 [Elysia crispata]
MTSVILPSDPASTKPGIAAHAQNNNLLCVLVDQEDDLSDWESPVDVDLACQPARRRNLKVETFRRSEEKELREMV